VTIAHFKQIVHSWTFKALKTKEVRFLEASGTAYRRTQLDFREGRIRRPQFLYDPEMFLA
jgi:hypothetical protein